MIEKVASEKKESWFSRKWNWIKEKVYPIGKQVGLIVVSPLAIPFLMIKETWTFFVASGAVALSYIIAIVKRDKDISFKDQQQGLLADYYMWATDMEVPVVI